MIHSVHFERFVRLDVYSRNLNIVVSDMNTGGSAMILAQHTYKINWSSFI